ncbi:MAG TPA: SCO family protein, partial [Geobacteraceae bacterium]|nr:SCO family protein [Geobacteraceae bacterium]
MGKMSGKPLVAILGVLLVGLTALAGVFPDLSQGHTVQDETLPNVGVDERLGARLPLDLSFTDQDGREVRLTHFFTGGPVILTLNYYSCPTLCPLIFRNLSNTISTIKGLSPAKDFRIVTVSIDPDETPARAR